ncbi:MAG: putative acetyltransferase [Saprospiraceae bacterium]|jgi:putative acetyltransferase
MVALLEVESDEEYKIAIELFKEYVAQINVDLSFQNFDREIKDIKYQYSRPNGVLIIGYDMENKAIGCFGIRRFADSICELKRMYLRKEVRGLGLGKKMLEKSNEIGKELNYRKMCLDTLQTMEFAIGLYEKNGFYEIDPYRFNPIEGTKYFEIKLRE